MGEGNLVVFKGTVDGIVVILDEKASFEEVISYFKQKLNESKTFFKGSKVGIRFKGRLLSAQEQEELIDILKKQNIINVSFVHPFENEPILYDEKMLWVKNELDTMNGSLTHFYYGIIRSGMEIEYPGNVIVFGDIKGKVHSGLDANFKKPFIISRGMAPIQIGIKNVIAPCPKEEKGISEELQIAYLIDEQVYVDVLDTKSISHMLSTNDKQGV